MMNKTMKKVNIHAMDSIKHQDAEMSRRHIKYVSEKV